MLQCDRCGSYRVETRLRLVDPKTGRGHFRFTDLSWPVLLIFAGLILYAAVDGLLSPSQVSNFFGLAFLGFFAFTLLMLLINYMFRDRYVEMLRHTCMDCKNKWNDAIPHLDHPVDHPAEHKE